MISRKKIGPPSPALKLATSNLVSGTPNEVVNNLDGHLHDVEEGVLVKQEVSLLFSEVKYMPGVFDLRTASS